MSSLRSNQGITVHRRSASAPAFIAAAVCIILSCVTQACPDPDSTDVGEADAPVRNALPSAELLLKRHVSAVGGREAILALRTRVASVHVVTDLEWDSPRHEVDTLSVYGTSSGEYLIVTRAEKGVMLEGCDGDEEWKVDFDGRVLSFDPHGARGRWMTDPQFSLKLRDYLPDMEVLGTDVWGTDIGGADHVYVVDIDGDQSHRLGFDVESGLLVRLGYNCELRDYREADGVLTPMSVAYSRKGGSSTYFVDALEHNAALDHTLFSLAK